MTHSHDHRIDQAITVLRRILRATELHERELAQSAGLTISKLRVLQALASREGRSATPTHLAQKLRVSQATVTMLVDQLESRALVMRRRSDRDRRQMHVVLVDAGGEALRGTPDVLQQYFKTGFERLQDWEQMMVVAVLDCVSQMLHPDLDDDANDGSSG